MVLNEQPDNISAHIGLGWAYYGTLDYLIAKNTDIKFDVPWYGKLGAFIIIELLIYRFLPTSRYLNIIMILVTTIIIWFYFMKKDDRGYFLMLIKDSKSYFLKIF